VRISALIAAPRMQKPKISQTQPYQTFRYEPKHI